MVMMYILRMLADVSFYAAFAGFIALRCGGEGAFAGLLLQCLCYGLSSLAGERRSLRLLLLLPMALGWVFAWGSPADCLLLVPPALYVLWLAWKGDYALDQERRQQLFGVFWKLLLVFAPLVMLMGAAADLSAVTLPWGLVMLVSSVLLMRALRHDRAVYRRRSYQLVNIAAVALVLAAALMISSRAVLNAAAALLRVVYEHLLQPILYLLLQVLIAVIWGVSWLFSWLGALSKGESEPQEVPQLNMEGAAEIFGETEVGEPGMLLRSLFICLGAAAAAVVLLLFFRWLGSRRGRGEAPSPSAERREETASSRRSPRRRESSPVRAVRAQYRRYLRACARQGLRPAAGDTSADICARASRLPGLGEVSAPIRRLYIAARYAGRADKAAVQTMKRLCAPKKEGVEE